MNYLRGLLVYVVVLGIVSLFGWKAAVAMVAITLMFFAFVVLIAGFFWIVGAVVIFVDYGFPSNYFERVKNWVRS